MLSFGKSNHWYLVVWPRKDGELSRFVGWLTLTHTQRWHARIAPHEVRADARRTAAGSIAQRPLVEQSHLPDPLECQLIRGAQSNHTAADDYETIRDHRLLGRSSLDESFASGDFRRRFVVGLVKSIFHCN